MFKIHARLLSLLTVFVLLAGCAAKAPTLNGQPFSANALKTLQSVQKVDTDFYVLDYYGDYGLDSLMKTGAKDESALAAFVSEKLLNGLDFPATSLKLACSSFAAKNPAGDYIQGRNMDFALAQNILVRTRPANGHASLAMASGALLNYMKSVPDGLQERARLLAAPYYAVDGINDAGVSIAVLLQTGAEVLRQNTGKPSMTTTMAVRFVLDKAATVNEAIDVLRAYDMQGMTNANFHFLIVDAHGDRAVVEYVKNELRVIRSKGYGLPVTNFFLSKDVKEAYRDGEDRIKILRAALNKNKGVVSEKQAWEMLESIKAVNDMDENTGINFNTAYSMIFNNTKRAMDVCINADFSKVFSYTVKGTFEKKAQQ
ncbi:linear amide C-N hydrolase [Desulfovibrio sp. OttesenSCG-928-G15]|nr:linear amide C-N hydrolase [Desulfovibrio sp. OttesenSCG-928-G15]